ncbi:putative lipid II flippase FtsW [Brachybacterium huguangmaarense]
MEQTRRAPGAAPRSERGSARRTAPAVVRPTEEHPLGDVSGRVRDGVTSWLRSPALDFYALAAIGTILLGLGLVMVLSSSTVISIASGRSPYAGLLRQGTFALIGLPLLIAAALLRPGFYKRMAWPLLVLGFALQLLVFTPLGYGAGGNRNWIRIGTMTLQPSELLKLALAVWLGMVLAHNHARLNRAAYIFGPIVPVVGLALGLVVFGHDLGTAMIMAMLVAGAMWVAGVPRRWFALLGAAGAAGVAGLVLTSPNRMARISTWLHGECVGSSCDQSSHGLMALAEGGWWGRGPGESAQKWGLLPAADNDYIFAIIGEELGLIGTLGVLVLFGLLALVLFRMITRADDLFVQIAVAGVSAWILGQAFTNMMVVTGVLPVLGVPLPFISAGGSALVASMTALGMLLSFARHEPGAADAIRANIRRVRRGKTVVPAPVAIAAEGGAARPRRARRGRRGAPSAASTASPRSASRGGGRSAARTAGRSTARSTGRSASGSRAAAPRSASSAPRTSSGSSAPTRRRRTGKGTR